MKPRDGAVRAGKALSPRTPPPAFLSLSSKERIITSGSVELTRRRDRSKKRKKERLKHHGRFTSRP